MCFDATSILERAIMCSCYDPTSNLVSHWSSSFHLILWNALHGTTTTNWNLQVGDQLIQRLRSPVRVAFSYGIEHSHCDSMKYDLMLHWITMSYADLVWKCLMYGTARSLLSWPKLSCIILRKICFCYNRGRLYLSSIRHLVGTIIPCVHVRGISEFSICMMIDSRTVDIPISFICAHASSLSFVVGPPNSTTHKGPDNRCGEDTIFDVLPS